MYTVMKKKVFFRFGISLFSWALFFFFFFLLHFLLFGMPMHIAIWAGAMLLSFIEKSSCIHL